MYVHNPTARPISVYAVRRNDSERGAQGKQIVFAAPGATIEIPEKYREKVRADLASPKLLNRLRQPMLIEVPSPDASLPPVSTDSPRDPGLGEVVDGQRELGVFDKGGKVKPKK